MMFLSANNDNDYDDDDDADDDAATNLGTPPFPSCNTNKKPVSTLRSPMPRLSSSPSRVIITFVL